MDEHTQRIFFEKRAALLAGDMAVKEQVANGKDIMSILCKLIPVPNLLDKVWNDIFIVKENLNASDEDRLSEEELLGQMS